MSAPPRSRLAAARTPSGYLLRVEGRGTLNESPAFQQFVLRTFRSECAVVVDLSECDYLDSTFLGCLVGLFKRRRKDGQGDFRLAAPQERRQLLLAPLRLDKLPWFTDAAPQPMGDWLTIQSSEQPEPRDLGEHVLECHQRLMETDDRNEAVFGPIVDQLAADLERMDDPQRETAATSCAR